MAGHEGSVGKAIASDIMQKNNYTKGPDLPSKKAAGPIALPGIHNISIKPASNGLSISHTPKATGKHADMMGGDYGKEETHVFGGPNAAKDAHKHLGKILGCPDCGAGGAGE